MLFNSVEFAVFLPVVFVAYLCLSARGRNLLLLLASYVFYGAWDWRFLSLLLASTVLDYAIGRALGATADPRRRRLLVTCSVVGNLGILGFFKYANFFADGLRALAAALGLPLPPAIARVVLPVGISFYTFQTLSYAIDVYRRDVEPTRRFLDFALYVALFPQLVAGPIERAGRLLPQVLARRALTWEGLSSGCWLLLWGLFKKMVVADSLAPLVDTVYAPGAAPLGWDVVLATWAFTFQIYCDFSGYTDVARGTARLFGFELMLNFNLPFFATDPADYWRRWHVSLSTWLRDYLYVPLGGNRFGTWKTYRNLALTMLLGGLWHGAAWTYVLWGAYHGALLVAHRALRPVWARVTPRSTLGRALWWLGRVALTFELVALGWVIFRAESVAQAGTLLAAILERPGIGVAAAWIPRLLVLALPLLAMQVWQARRGSLDVVLEAPGPVRSVIYAAVLLALVALGQELGEPFIYFQF
jgi:D-alanyl-lipoteichoic acid acyltransferase DltB (MBOAT superfamily)